MKLMLKVAGVLCLSAVVWWLSVTASEPQSDLDNTIKGESKVSESKASATQSMKEENTDITERMERSTVVTDFDDQSVAEQWRTVNDTVMGGVSQSTFSVTPEGTGIFSGDLSLENNGGFSSVRRALPEAAFAEAEGVMIRVKGDGRRYQLRFRMSRAENAVSYRAEFTPDSEDWTTVWLPFDEFEPVFRGRMVEDAPGLTPEEIQEIGLFLADGQPGEFKLQIDWIRAG